MIGDCLHSAVVYLDFWGKSSMLAAKTDGIGLRDAPEMQGLSSIIMRIA